MKQSNDDVFLTKLKNMFKKQRPVNVGDLGVYHYVWSCDTFNDYLHENKYDIFLKIEALETYDDLVEIKILDTKISETATSDIVNIIKTTLPKYVKAREVKWKIKY